MNGRQRNATNAQIWGKFETRIMMSTVPHVTSGSGLRKFLADGFLFDRVYMLHLKRLHPIFDKQMKHSRTKKTTF